MEFRETDSPGATVGPSLGVDDAVAVKCGDCCINA